jgi:hypothetical protein
MGPVEDIMQILHVTSKGARLNVLEKFHTQREIKRDNQKKQLHKAAERVWALVKIFFRASQQGQIGKWKSKETQQSYARWPLGARSVNMTNHYLFIFGIIEKDKNIG